MSAFLLPLFFCLCILRTVCGIAEVIWAVNCGGSSHTDENGIQYMADPLDVGIESSFGRSLLISRVIEEDMIIYQTERYDTQSFSYEFPRPSDGDYVLTLKFSEVWFQERGGKVFDVSINGEILVIRDLDIFAKVGYATAHDENIAFSIKDNVLRVDESSMDITGQNSITIDFLKGQRDNPKVNAIVVFRGTIDDVPKLPELQEPEPEPEFIKPAPPPKRSKPLPLAAPPAPDPYSSMDTSYLLPILISLGAFFPILFCLCKI